jgi:hypothetical protein
MQKDLELGELQEQLVVCIGTIRLPHILLFEDGATGRPKLGSVPEVERNGGDSDPWNDQQPFKEWYKPQKNSAIPMYAP